LRRQAPPFDGPELPQCWSEAWPVIGKAHDSALAGDTAFLEDQHIFLERHGYNEECFFTFSFSPIRSEGGHVGGLFHPVIEMTAKVLGERRTRTLRDLATLVGRAKSIEEAITLSSQTLAPTSSTFPSSSFICSTARPSRGAWSRRSDWPLRAPPALWWLTCSRRPNRPGRWAR